MGELGLRDAHEMCELAAQRLGIPASQVLVGSTGVIGRRLPISKIAAAVPQLAPQRAGGAEFARAIMTTDTVPKSRALRVRIGDRSYAIGGAAKGSGMVHPDMATVFGFFTTDAQLTPARLQVLLREVADVSFNMVDVDMDTSTSDTMLLFASGAAGGGELTADSAEERAFAAALRTLAVELARDLARDGEGARTLIEMEVTGARSLEDARRAARTVVSSPLVKTMVTGRDPNLGRVMMALGRSGAEVQVERISVWIGGQCAFERGAPTELDYAAISRAMDAPEVTLRADLGLGEWSATAWGCDLTADYVSINADYTT
jgi:glutamate N-acetyltransferase/amino-acid N-acetyltransferase